MAQSEMGETEFEEAAAETPTSLLPEWFNSLLAFIEDPKFQAKQLD